MSDWGCRVVVLTTSPVSVRFSVARTDRRDQRPRCIFELFVSSFRRAGGLASALVSDRLAAGFLRELGLGSVGFGGCGSVSDRRQISRPKRVWPSYHSRARRFRPTPLSTSSR